MGPEGALEWACQPSSRTSASPWRLADADVPYAVCGGFAMAIHAREVGLVSETLSTLPAARIDTDPVLGAFRDATGRGRASRSITRTAATFTFGRGLA